MKKEIYFTSEEERLIGEKLEKVVSQDIEGYEYLRAAILITIKNNKLEMDKVICPNISKIYGLKEKRVESKLKKTVELAFDKNEKDFIEFFGEDNYFKCQDLYKFIKKFIEIYYLS